MRLYYAQNKEDLFIKAFFPDVKKGFYIDVGANDPVIDSVTKLLYEEGWHGINVEPISRHINALNKDRPLDVNVQIGLSSKPGELTFTEYPDGDGLSTFDDSMRESYKKGDEAFPTQKTKEYKVPVKTLELVIEENDVKHIHFIKIDVEGYEYEVIAGYKWEAVRPELICIEANHIHTDWRPILEKNKYSFVFFDGVNNYYLAKESMHRNDFFNYPDIAFSGNPVYYPTFNEIVDSTVEKQEEIANERISPLVSKIQDQEWLINELQKKQRDVRFLAKRLHSELQIRLNRRAKTIKIESGLRYKKDESLKDAISNDSDDPQKLVSFIEKRDYENIVSDRGSVKNVFKPLFWKIAAKSFALLSIFARKLAHI